MKSLDSDKKAGKSGAVEEATANDNNGFFKDNAKIDFSNVKVEPLFEEEVDFDTFSRSDFRAVKVKECAPAPIGKHLWGTVTIGSKGQIVIPKAARETFELNEGDRLVVLGDDAEGIALVKADVFEQRVQEALKLSRQMTNE